MTLRVAFFNRFFKEWPKRAHLAEAGIEPSFGPLDCEMAEAVVFHLPTLPAGLLLERPKPAGQIWVGWCLESRVTCPAFGDPRVRERCDLMMSHERSADVFTPYFSVPSLKGFRRPPRTEHEPIAVVHLQSNPYDRCGRNRYVFDLMRHIKVDSCGRLLKTCDREVGPGFEGRVALMARYKFTLAMENSISSDYVTDKFYDPLTVGSVPVYRGSADVRELAPAPDCYIDAADFESPAALAAHLRHLATDDEAYAALHAWRTRPFSPSFEQLVERVRTPTFVQLARAVRKAQGVDRGGRSSKGSIIDGG
ncbi:MAG: glycosyltransferase family 10 [Acidobacteriota bacterium]